MSTPISVEIMTEINNHVMKQMSKAIKFAKKKIDSRTPEDSKRLVKGNKIVEPVITGSRISAKVINVVPYASYVEFGRGKSMNYHKWPAGIKKKKGSGSRYVIRTGVGARMMSLTKDIDGNEIATIIKS